MVIFDDYRFVYWSLSFKCAFKSSPLTCSSCHKRHAVFKWKAQIFKRLIITNQDSLSVLSTRALICWIQDLLILSLETASMQQRKIIYSFLRLLMEII